jgi:hypothetical protein
MIEVILFYLHVVFFAFVFARNYVEEGFTSALLSTIFVIVIFSVGWTFSAFVIGFFVPDQGFTRVLTKAAFSLTFLTVLEAVFYKFYYGGKRTPAAA